MLKKIIIYLYIEDKESDPIGAWKWSMEVEHGSVTFQEIMTDRKTNQPQQTDQPSKRRT